MPKQANSVLFAVKILYFLALAVPKPKNSESKTRFEIMDLLAPVSGKATTVEKGARYPWSGQFRKFSQE